MVRPTLRQRVQRLFARALKRPPEERPGVVAASTDVPEVRNEVLALLEAHEQAGPFDRIADRLQGVRSAIAFIPPPDLFDRLQTGLAGQYRLEREFARGGSALVFLAQDLRRQCTVAIKVLQPRLADGIGAARFLQEISIGGRLRHPHILPLLDSGEIGGLLYQVMPYLEGGSLRERLRQVRPIKLSEALRITQHVASALHYAHVQGIIHRDIKPENILFRDGEAVVTDFGIATAVTAREEGQPETVVGTPAYMSPEQACGKDTVDARSDQYSLACVGYEMLTGAPFITGASTEEVLRRNQAEPPAVITKNLARVPREVIVVLRRALSADPAARFPTIAEFAEACLAGAGLAPVSEPQRPGGTRDRPEDSGTTSPDRPDRNPGAAG